MPSVRSSLTQIPRKSRGTSRDLCTRSGIDGLKPAFLRCPVPPPCRAATLKRRSRESARCRVPGVPVHGVALVVVAISVHPPSRDARDARLILRRRRPRMCADPAEMRTSLRSVVITDPAGLPRTDRAPGSTLGARSASVATITGVAIELHDLRFDPNCRRGLQIPRECCGVRSSLRQRGVAHSIP